MLSDYYRHQWLHLIHPTRSPCRVDRLCSVHNVSGAGPPCGKIWWWSCFSDHGSQNRDGNKVVRKIKQPPRFSREAEKLLALVFLNATAMGRRAGCESTVLSLLPQSREHPQGFRREDRWEDCGKVSASVKPPARDLPGAILLWDLCLYSRGTTEKGNQNLSIGKPSREFRFQAWTFLLTSLISHQLFQCILHFFGDSNLYFSAIIILIN